MRVRVDATSTSSRSKLTGWCDVVICTSICGLNAWKRARSGTSHRMAKVGGTFTRSVCASGFCCSWRVPCST
jgi:hypothetical protein